MAEQLLSLGLDVGTTTTQLILSKLTVENQAGSFAVPMLEITERTIFYRSPVLFTPLISDCLVDGQSLRQWVAQQYQAAGIQRQQVDTGAIIITGETSRKENAAQVVSSLSGFAGDFVVATAGPNLESVLAAKGSGAVEVSKRTGKTLLHMDIGGGTSNLSLIEDGSITATGCLNVGGRLLKFDDAGRIIYRSPVLQGLTPLQEGQIPTLSQLQELARLLTQALEMAAGLREPTSLLQQLTTAEAGYFRCTVPVTVSFSGGVADCIDTGHPPLAFGDMGPVLGQAIRDSRLCQGEYLLGEHTIRATVIGAGCHSTQLSGSTVFCRGVELPVQNLPVAVFSKEQQQREDFPNLIRQALSGTDADALFLALPGYPAASYQQVKSLAANIAAGTQGRPIFVCVESDMAKALGHALCLLNPDVPCLCIDRIHLTPDTYLDVGTPVGPALPVVVKTLAFGST